jgi:autotransporter-associated beta strand protein
MYPAGFRQLDEESIAMVQHRVCIRFLLGLVASAGLARPALGATFTWTGGGGANSNWSEKANWGGTAPANGATDLELVFPALAKPYKSTNDLSGLRVSALHVTTQLGSGNYTFAGTGITLDGNATMDSPGSGSPNLLWQLPLSLGQNATITTSGRQTQLQGTIGLGAHTLTLDCQGDIYATGAISGSGGLVKTGGSALTVKAANTYSGATEGFAGAFYLADAAALGAAGAGTTIHGGFLGFTGSSTYTLAEPLVFDGGKILAYGTPTISAPITLNTTIQVQAFDTAALLTLSGAIGGSGGLIKSGVGRVVLAAAATAEYAGATQIDEGTLQLDADLTGSAPLTVKNGATLKGNGSCGGTIVVESGATLAPGSSPGALASKGLTMASGATYAVEINGPQAGAQHDTLAVNGAVTLGGATLAVALGYAPPDGTQFPIITAPGAASGNFAGLAEGASLQLGTSYLTIGYHGGAGGNVVLVAGPPPTATRTPTSVASATATRTATAPGATVTATRSGTAVGSATATATPTPTYTPTPTFSGPCTGDCDGNGAVTVNEVVLGVSFALSGTVGPPCEAIDADRDGRASIAELIAAVGNALDGCGN